MQAIATAAMISAVFDCVVYVQAFLSRCGPAFACIQLADAEFLRLYLNPEILQETSARFVVSRDKDLLDLMKDASFRTTYPAIQVLSPSAFLEHVRTEVARGEGIGEPIP